MGRAADIFKKLVSKGEQAIDEFIYDRQTEELFLDFKRANSDGNYNYNSLHKDDRKNLSKAISGFGNSEGGVLVWGVDCSRDLEDGDVAKAKNKVYNVRRFLSWLESAVSGCTIPPHKGVVNQIIHEDAEGNGYIATFIPNSDFAPHMAANNIYYIRSGSSTLPVPHSVLSGMFGKRPQPNLTLEFADKSIEICNNIDPTMASGRNIESLPDKYVVIKFAVQAQNNSNAIARELFFTCNNKTKGGANCILRFYNFGSMDAMQGVKGHISLISKPEMRLPPGGQLNFTNVEVILTPPVTDDFQIEGVIGADNSIPKSFKLFVTADDLRKIMEDAFTMAGMGEFSESQKEYFINKFFKKLEMSK